MWQTAFWLLMINYVLALLTATLILRERREPMTMLAWIFAVFTLPYVGLGLYYGMGAQRIQRKARRRRRRLSHLATRFQASRERIGEEPRRAVATLPRDLVEVERIGERLVGIPAVGGNSVTAFMEANATYAALESAIRAARDHIHMTYYIWQPDDTGRHFRDLLVQQAKAGIECRVLLDAVGCWNLTRGFMQPLLDAGGKVAFFMPLWPLRRRWSPHLRNHRKIVVVDGADAFLGSQNIGDEYRGRLKRLSPWLDAHLRVRGPAAQFVQESFLEDWFFTTGEDLAQERYFPPPATPGTSIVQILPTGPDQPTNALTQMLFAAVASAERSILLETPYFVPDPAFCAALTYACYRGVIVQMVIPTRTDAPLALLAGRSFYPELLRAGVDIHEYDHGVLHSKLITVDDRWCLVSSANMDVRSFRLNFEISAVVYDETVAAPLARRIESHGRNSRHIGLDDHLKQPWYRQMLEGGARLFAPLL